MKTVSPTKNVLVRTFLEDVFYNWQRGKRIRPTVIASRAATVRVSTLLTLSQELTAGA